MNSTQLSTPYGKAVFEASLEVKRRSCSALPDFGRDAPRGNAPDLRPALRNKKTTAVPEETAVECPRLRDKRQDGSRVSGGEFDDYDAHVTLQFALPLGPNLRDLEIPASSHPIYAAFSALFR
jgi:hypothetical protein